MKNSLAVIAGLVLIAVGVGLFLFRGNPKPPPAPPPTPPPVVEVVPAPPTPPAHVATITAAWKELPPGSWAVIETTRIRDGVTKTDKEKFTRVDEPGKGPAIKFQKAAGTSFEEPGQPVEPLVGALVEAQTRWKPSEPTTEKLKIGAQEHECKVTVYLHENPQRKIVNRVAVWRSTGVKVPYRQLQRNGPDVALPPDVLRIEFKVQADAQYQIYDLRVTDLDAKIKVGDREISCVLEEGTVDEVRKGISAKGTLKRWLSDAVPGRVVRSESAGTSAGAPVSRTEAVLDFAPPK